MPGKRGYKMGYGMDAGAKATGGSMQHDGGLAHASKCVARARAAQSAGKAAYRSAMSQTHHGQMYAERPSHEGGVHGHPSQMGQPHNPAMVGYGSKKVM